MKTLAENSDLILYCANFVNNGKYSSKNTEIKIIFFLTLEISNNYLNTISFNKKLFEIDL